MRYQDGNIVNLGDTVEHAGSSGVVIAVPSESGEFCTLADFEWTKTSEQGLWVQFVNGAIVHLCEPDEDLELIRRVGDRIAE
jgi:hypothetical protein